VGRPEGPKKNASTKKKETDMRTILSDGRMVICAFPVDHTQQGEHRTNCMMTVGSDNGAEPPTTVLTEARCLPGRRYNKAMDKATTLDRACHLLFPDPADRPHRQRIWATFFRCLRTPDISVLSGAPRCVAPARPILPAGLLLALMDGHTLMVVEPIRPVRAGC
jgi:hypothetical protein